MQSCCTTSSQAKVYNAAACYSNKFVHLLNTSREHHRAAISRIHIHTDAQSPSALIPWRGWLLHHPPRRLCFAFCFLFWAGSYELVSFSACHPPPNMVTAQAPLHRSTRYQQRQLCISRGSTHIGGFSFVTTHTTHLGFLNTPVNNLVVDAEVSAGGPIVKLEDGLVLPFLRLQTPQHSTTVKRHCTKINKNTMQWQAHQHTAPVGAQATLRTILIRTSSNCSML